MTREMLLVAAVALLASTSSAQDEPLRLERTLGSTRWRSRWSGASDVVVLPDGQRVVRAALDVVLADLVTGRVLRSFERPGPGGRMGGEDDFRLALSPDGAFLAVVGHQAPVVVHAVAGADAERAAVELPTASCGAIAAAFTRDGARLLVLDPVEEEGAEGVTLRTFAVGTWAEGTPRPLREAWGLAAGPDGALATHDHRTVAVLDGPTPRVVDLGEETEVLGCFFVDATTLFVVDADAPRVLRLDVARAEVVGEWELQEHPRVFAVGPGLLALAQGEGPIEVRDLEGEPVARLVGHTTAATALAFSPDGRRLVSVSGGCETRVWDVTAGCEVEPFVGHSGTISRLAWTADGTLWSASDRNRTSRAWDVSSGQQVDVRPATWVPLHDRRWLSYYGMGVDLQPAAEGGSPWHAYPVSDLAVLADGDVLLAQPEGVARFAPPATEPRWRTAWDLEPAARPKLAVAAHGGLVVVWIPGEARVLDVTSGALVTRLELEDVEPTDVLGRDTLLASSRTGQVLAFDLRRPGPPRDLGWGRGARASSDGRLLAWVRGEGVVVVDPAGDRRWELQTPEANGPATLAWSPDGRRLAVGHQDGLVTVWTRPR